MRFGVRTVNDAPWMISRPVRVGGSDHILVRTGHDVPGADFVGEWLNRTPSEWSCLIVVLSAHADE